MSIDKVRIQNRILQIIRKIEGNSQEVTLRSHLFNDLGFTSISSIELVIEVEQIYGIDLIEKLTNMEIQYVEDLINHVYELKIEEL